MTANEIRAAATAQNSNWEILQMAIADGMEYPDAVARVAQALRLPLDEVEQMERDYDECA